MSEDNNKIFTKQMSYECSRATASNSSAPKQFQKIVL